GASAEWAVGVEGAPTREVAVSRSLSPKPLNRSRGSRRGANTAAAPINNPGTSAASTMAAPAATAPRVATVPTTPGARTQPGNQPARARKEVEKEVSPSARVPVWGYKRRESAAVK